MNLPNVLSLIRLGMVPLVPAFYFSEVPYGNLWAAGIYGLASLTDVLDGVIARKYGLITRLGRVLDPLADKCMSFCVLICIIIKWRSSIPELFWAGVVFFCKESLMGLGALVQYKKIDDVPPSNFIGKISTAFFFAAFFLILVFESALPRIVIVGAVWVSITLTILAFFKYLLMFVSNIKKD